jgi:hypothetical protein
MRIEVGGPPRYQGLDFIRARGWTYWHHLFNPRQLLLAALVNQFSDAKPKFGFAQVLNNNCRASRWHPGAGPGATVGIFDNQPLSTIFNYGCRGSHMLRDFYSSHTKLSHSAACSVSWSSPFQPIKHKSKVTSTLRTLPMETP